MERASKVQTNLIVLMGKQGSGKTTLCDYMVKNMGYEKVVTYTTRPMRTGEVDGVDYHFLADEEFENMIKKNQFIENKQYNTINGIWKYGTALDKLESGHKYILIVTPDGYYSIKERIVEYGCGLRAIYLNVSDALRLERLAYRGDENAEIKRREQKDNEDFADIANDKSIEIYELAKEKLTSEIASDIIR